MGKFFTCAVCALLLAAVCLLFCSCSAAKTVSSTLTSASTQTTQTTQTTQITQTSTQHASTGNTSEPQNDLSYINRFREDYNVGTCKELSGNVAVVLFFIDDFESEWTDAEIARFTEKEIEPGLAFLEKQANNYGITLNLNIEKSYKSIYYSGEVIESINSTGMATIDVLAQAANAIGYSNTVSMLNRFRILFQADNVVCFTIFNKDGTAYAINPKKDEALKIDEHCIIFARDLGLSANSPDGSQASVIAHEMLHLFGAEDFYAISTRKALAKTYYPNDIMLGANYIIETNCIGEATAFYIGWTDKLPLPLLNPDWN